MSRSTKACIVVVSLALLPGCDFFKDGESPPARRSIAISFRVESELPPNGGWVYWHVDQGVLHRQRATVSHGPVGARADCGSHAGLAALVEAGPDAPERIALVIETIESDPDSAVVAREEFSGTGEHQLVVIVSCP